MPKTANKNKRTSTVTTKATARRKIKNEPNIEITDTITDDAGFMDTHFGDDDSDNDFNGSSTMAVLPDPPKAEPIASKKQDSGKPKAKPRRPKSGVNAQEVRIILDQSPRMLDCKVAIEPLDLNLYAHLLKHQISNDTAPTIETEPIVPIPVNQCFEIARPSTSAPIVPPLTLRIKKEVLNPDYGDGFDPELARSIKQEKSNEVWELAGPSPAPARKKKSKKQPKGNKLYKKPALLAMKIKQERFDHNEHDTYFDNQQHSVVSELVETNAVRSFDSSLPIITQIHSNIAPVSNSGRPASTSSMVINPIRLVQGLDMHPTLSPLIRIKSEPIDQPDEEVDSMHDTDYMPMDTSFDDVANSLGSTVPITGDVSVGTFPTISSVESNIQSMIGHIKQEQADPCDIEHNMDGEQSELPELPLLLTYQQHDTDNLPQEGDDLEGCVDNSEIDESIDDATNVVTADTNFESQAAVNHANMELQSDKPKQIVSSELEVQANLIDNSANTNDYVHPMKDSEPIDTATSVECAHVSKIIISNATPANDDNDAKPDSTSMDLFESAASESPTNLLDDEKNAAIDGEDIAGNNVDSVAIEEIKSPENSPETSDANDRGVDSAEQQPNENATDNVASLSAPIDNATNFTVLNQVQENATVGIDKSIMDVPTDTTNKKSHDFESISRDSTSFDVTVSNEDEKAQENVTESDGKMPKCDRHIEDELPGHGLDNEQTQGNPMENDSATSIHIVDNLLNIEPSHEFDINSMVTNSEDNSILDTIDELVREVANEMISSDDPPPPADTLRSPSVSASASSSALPSASKVTVEDANVSENESGNFVVPSFLDPIGTFEKDAEQTSKESNMGTLFGEQFVIGDQAPNDQQ